MHSFHTPVAARSQDAWVLQSFQASKREASWRVGCLCVSGKEWVPRGDACPHTGRPEAFLAGLPDGPPFPHVSGQKPAKTGSAHSNVFIPQIFPTTATHTESPEKQAQFLPSESEGRWAFLELEKRQAGWH